MFIKSFAQVLYHNLLTNPGAGRSLSNSSDDSQSSRALWTDVFAIVGKKNLSMPIPSHLAEEFYSLHP